MVVSEIVINVLRMGLETKEMVSSVDYRAVLEINCEKIWWAAELRHVDLVPPDEKVMLNDGKNRLRAQQKSMHMMMNIMCKFTRG